MVATKKEGPLLEGLPAPVSKVRLLLGARLAGSRLGLARLALTLGSVSGAGLTHGVTPPFWAKIHVALFGIIP